MLRLMMLDNLAQVLNLSEAEIQSAEKASSTNKRPRSGDEDGKHTVKLLIEAPSLKADRHQNQTSGIISRP